MRFLIKIRSYLFGALRRWNLRYSLDVPVSTSRSVAQFRLVSHPNKKLLKFVSTITLFWVSLSIFASCAPDSILMHLLPCGSMSHESVLCPMIILDSTKNVAEAVLIFKNSAHLILLALVVVAFLTRPIYQKIFSLLQNFRSSVWRVPILFANWLQLAFKTGLLNPKTF